MLKIKNVSKSYNDVLFENLNYFFKKEVYHLLGTNGTGKSTLLKCICSLESYDGEIEINGETNLKSSEILSTHVSYISQELSLFSGLTVRENIDFVLQGKHTDKLNELVEHFEFEYCLEKNINSLSSGEQKITQFIIGVALSCPILLLDEVDNFLDDTSKERVSEIVESYDGLVIFTSHTKLVSNATPIDLADMNVVNDTQMETYKVKKISRSVEKISRKLTKSKYLTIFTIIVLICSLGVGYGITRKASQYSSGLSSDQKIFYDDTAVLIYPPFENQDSYEYQTADWYNTTPYYLPESLLDEILNLPYVTEAEGVLDPNSSTSYFIVDGVKYYSETDIRPTMSSLPYNISKNLNINGIFPKYIEGELPRDDAFEAVASKQYMIDNNLEIGDKTTIEGTDDNGNTKQFKYTIVGIENLSRSSSIITSYQSDNVLGESEDLDTEEGREIAVNTIQANSPSPIQLDDISPDDVYYPCIYVKTDSVENTKKLIKYIQDYDQYIGIKSNFEYSTSLISRYQREKDIHLFSKIIIIYAVLIVGIGSLLIKIEFKRLNDSILKPLQNYGFSNKEISIVYKKCISKYMLITGYAVLFMLLLAVFYRILLAKLMLLGSLIVLVVLVLIIMLSLRRVDAIKG